MPAKIAAISLAYTKELDFKLPSTYYQIRSRTAQAAAKIITITNDDNDLNEAKASRVIILKFPVKLPVNSQTAKSLGIHILWWT